MKTKSIFPLAAVAAITLGGLQKTIAQNTPPFWSLAGNSGTNSDTQFLGTTDNKSLVFKTQDKKRMAIGQGGNVGIGIFENIGFPLNFASTLGDKISLYGNSGAHYGFGIQSNLLQIHSLASTADIAFGYGSSAAFTERMRIKGTGNVGIGTASPAAKLHITGGSDAGLSGGFIITGDLVSANMGIDNNEIQTRTGGIASTLYLNNDGGDINLRADAMHITSGKLVGIGTASPTNKFHVVGTSLLNGHVSVGSEQPDATWDLKIGTTTNDGFLMGTVETLQDFGGSTFGSNSNIVPTADRVRSLGSSTNRWSAVWTFTGIINTSDIRDKKNIRDLDYGLEKIMQLHPVKFNWKEGISTSDKIGLVAQEIQKVLPDVVVDYDIKTDEATGKQEKVPAARLGVNYTDLIPVLVKSIQELQMQITELKKQVNDKTSITSSEDNKVKIANTAANALLEQNAPNPFNSITTIRYNIPASVSNAQIMVTNASGNVIKTFTLNNKGAGSVNIRAGELASGSYYYTLVVDGKKADSKKMILNK